jgi:hypothetical protein
MSAATAADDIDKANVSDAIKARGLRMGFNLLSIFDSFDRPDHDRY